MYQINFYINMKKHANYRIVFFCMFVLFLLALAMFLSYLLVEEQLTDVDEVVIQRPVMLNSDQFICFHCPFSSNKAEHIREHLQTHSECRRKSFSRKVSGANRFTCYQCSFTTDTENAISEHLQSHVAEPHYNCYMCDRKFHFKHELTLHLKTHANCQTFRCDLCSREFSRLSMLSYHRKYHTDKKLFECHYCHKVFCDIISFNQHESIHTDTNYVNRK